MELKQYNNWSLDKEQNKDRNVRQFGKYLDRTYYRQPRIFSKSKQNILKSDYSLHPSEKTQKLHLLCNKIFVLSQRRWKHFGESNLSPHNNTLCAKYLYQLTLRPFVFITSIPGDNRSLKYPIIMKYLLHLLPCAIKFILQHSVCLNHQLKFSITSRINRDIYEAYFNRYNTGECPRSGTPKRYHAMFLLYFKSTEKLIVYLRNLYSLLDLNILKYTETLKYLTWIISERFVLVCPFQRLSR